MMVVKKVSLRNLYDMTLRCFLGLSRKIRVELAKKNIFS